MERIGGIAMALKVGIQLYSVRTEMEKDPFEAIRKVAEIGYKNLEVANSRADEDPGVGFRASLHTTARSATNILDSPRTSSRIMTP